MTTHKHKDGEEPSEDTPKEKTSNDRVKELLERAKTAGPDQSIDFVIAAIEEIMQGKRGKTK